eukprot:356130-Chlamydomonas_euryale.AAC.4
MDELWRAASGGKFGYSVQARILAQAPRRWARFFRKIGWVSGPDNTYRKWPSVRGLNVLQSALPAAPHSRTCMCVSTGARTPACTRLPAHACVHRTGQCGHAQPSGQQRGSVG